MRHLLLALGILCGTVLSGTAANAQNYPWCAQYGGRMGGGQNSVSLDLRTVPSSTERQWRFLQSQHPV